MKALCFAVVWGLAICPGSATAASTTTAPAVVDRPMPATNYDDRSASDVIDTIIVHFSSDVIANPQSPFSVDRIYDIYVKYHCSTHYLIDREGRIYRFVDENKRAWHAGKGEVPWDPERKNQMNQHSIGIEILAIGSARDMRPFMNETRYHELAASHPDFVGYTDGQYKALNRLIDGIIQRHPAIKRDRYHIIGHEDYAPGRKTDPGELFDWSRIGLPRACPSAGSDTQTTPSLMLSTRDGVTTSTSTLVTR